MEGICVASYGLGIGRRYMVMSPSLSRAQVLRRGWGFFGHPSITQSPDLRSPVGSDQIRRGGLFRRLMFPDLLGPLVEAAMYEILCLPNDVKVTVINRADYYTL